MLDELSTDLSPLGSVRAPKPLRIGAVYPATDGLPELSRLARLQNGVMRRDQCRAIGLHRSYVRNQLDAQRWTAWGDKVLLLRNAPPNRRQLMWIAVLDASPIAALCSHTSLELAGFKPVATEANQIHLLVPRGAKVTRFPGVVVHESRRLGEERWTRDRGLARTEDPRSVIDAAAWQPWPRFACFMLAAAVQQRLCTPAELDQALSYVGRVRHKVHLRAALVDVAGGAHSLGELDVAAICRRHRLVPPNRQIRRRDQQGNWRFLDCEWDLPSGEIIVLEIDGSHPMDVAQWQADMRPERGVVISRRWVLRATAFEVRFEPHVIVADLKALGVPTT
jgi:hypothetical protein